MNDSKVTFGQMQAAYRAAGEIMRRDDIEDEVELIEFCCGQENAEFNLQMIDLVARIITFTEMTNDLRKG
jgi:hypothetical protein